MNVSLPVWTIRPNWKQGVTERLEWLTDVIGSTVGAEQRRSCRLSPRRSFEITVNPTQRERTYVDLLLHRLGSKEWLFPLWHDQAKLTQRAVVGAQALMFDNAFREHRDGDYALLYIDCFNYEVVRVQTAWDGGLVLANDVEREWPVGTKVYPLREGWMSSDTALAALTSRVGESIIGFTVNDENDYPEAPDAELTIHEGSPLLTIEPNRVRQIDVSHVRLTAEADGQVGLTSRIDTANRAFAVQSHNWLVVGRERQAAFRRFLYRLRGRQRMVWLPTFNDDLTLAQPVAQGATQARIGYVGLRYVGGSSPIPGRSILWTGTEVLKIASHMAPQAANEDRVGLATPTTRNYAPGASWGFLQAARMDQDAIELQHYTDSDGVFECSATFRTFANVRDASGSNFLPIPATAKTPGACGVGEDNPCDVTFPGWFWKISLNWEYPPADGFYPNIYATGLPQTSDRFPNGGRLYQGTSFSRNTLNPAGNDNMVIRDVANGWDVLDGPNGGPMMDFRWRMAGPKVLGYEWTFYFPLSTDNHHTGWSHQFAYNSFPTGDGHEAILAFRQWDVEQATTKLVYVYRLFPADYAIDY